MTRLVLLIFSLALNAVLAGEIYGAMSLPSNGNGYAVCEPMTAYTGPLGLIACKPQFVNGAQ